MGEKIKNKPFTACWILFAILIVVHGFEAIVLRMDETVLGENFINKVFGIVLIFVVLGLLKWAPKDIGEELFKKYRYRIAFCDSVFYDRIQRGSHHIKEPGTECKLRYLYDGILADG